MATINSVPEICELGIRIEPASDQSGHVRCVAELRLFNGDIPIGDEDCEISISRATISIDLEGLSPLQGTRYGEPRKPNAVPIEKGVKQAKVADRSFKAGGEVRLDNSKPNLKLGVGGGIKGSATSETTLSSLETIEHLRVRAIPNLRWEIREAEDTPLDGTYLDGESLVELTKLEHANRSSLGVTLKVKQRDLEIKQGMSGDLSPKFFARFTNNQRRLLDIFIAKSLSAAVSGRGEYRGEISLSEHTDELFNEE